MLQTTFAVSPAAMFTISSTRNTTISHPIFTVLVLRLTINPNMPVSKAKRTVVPAPKATVTKRTSIWFIPGPLYSCPNQRWARGAVGSNRRDRKNFLRISFIAIYLLAETCRSRLSSTTLSVTNTTPKSCTPLSCS